MLRLAIREAKESIDPEKERIIFTFPLTSMLLVIAPESAMSLTRYPSILVADAMSPEKPRIRIASPTMDATVSKAPERVLKVLMFPFKEGAVVISPERGRFSRRFEAISPLVLMEPENSIVPESSNAAERLALDAIAPMMVLKMLVKPATSALESITPEIPRIGFKEAARSDTVSDAPMRFRVVFAVPFKEEGINMFPSIPRKGLTTPASDEVDETFPDISLTIFICPATFPPASIIPDRFTINPIARDISAFTLISPEMPLVTFVVPSKEPEVSRVPCTFRVAFKTFSAEKVIFATPAIPI